MTADPTASTDSRAAGGTRAILAASVGNLLEWYDFSVYALFAIYIGANFFPKGNPGADLVKAFLVFGLGFVVRPLGSIVIGVYGDRAGRKAALTATIWPHRTFVAKSVLLIVQCAIRSINEWRLP